MSSKLSRRDVLKKAASAGASLGFASPLLMNDKANNQEIILGSGSHRYRCIHDWLTAPVGLKFGDTHGLAQDKAGRIYVAHTVGQGSFEKSGVCVYDPFGGFIASWGSEFAGGAHGLDLRQEADGKEYLYHCDTSRCLVVKTDLDGKAIWTIGTPGEANVYSESQRFVPTNVAFSPDGDLFIADGYGSSYVHRYSKDGAHKLTFGGGRTSEKGKLNCPHGLWVDSRGSEPLLAIADRSNNRIQYFNLDGQHAGFVSEGMRLPCDFDIRGDEMLVPDLDSIVTLLDKDNKVILQLGDGKPSSLRGRPKSEFIPGKFIHPHDAIFLANGDILVAEWVPQGRVTLLQKLS